MRKLWCFFVHRFFPMQFGHRTYDFVGFYTCRCRLCGNEWTTAERR